MTTHSISISRQLVNVGDGDTISLPSLIGLPPAFFAIVTVDSDVDSVTFTSENGQSISGFPDELVYKLAGFNVIYLTISRTLGWIVTPLAIDIVDLLASVDISLPLTVSQGGTGSTTATSARTTLSAAESGANTDITSLTGITNGIVVSAPASGTGINISVPYNSLSNMWYAFTSTGGTR